MTRGGCGGQEEAVAADSAGGAAGGDAAARLASRSREIADAGKRTARARAAYKLSSAGCMSLRAASVRLPVSDGYTANVCAR